MNYPKHSWKNLLVMEYIELIKIFLTELKCLHTVIGNKTLKMINISAMVQIFAALMPSLYDPFPTKK